MPDDEPVSSIGHYVTITSTTAPGPVTLPASPHSVSPSVVELETKVAEDFLTEKIPLLVPVQISDGQFG